MEVQLKPKPKMANKRITITFPTVTMTVQEFCDFFNKIGQVLDEWYTTSGEKDEKTYYTILAFLNAIEIPEGLPAKYPEYFDVETSTKFI